MPTLIGTKTKISTKTAVALAAGAVILAAAAAGGFSVRNKSGNGFFATQGYGPGNAYLDVRFSTRPGFGKATPGDTGVKFADYRVKAVGTDITIFDFNPMLLVQDTLSSSPFTIGTDGALVAEEHLTNCVLKDRSTGNVMSGPLFSGSGIAPAFLLFTDDFTLSAGQTMNLTLECDFTAVPVSGSSDALAVNFATPNDIVAKEAYPSLVPVPVQMTSTNGNPPAYYILEQ
ncbi:TPA: hypothetical protein DDZ10_00460 [Candidatus Uhrbacteria bacterium]|uniref:SipW-cognate class signal peptide n=1 Tax=Candidatus Uhrbacteria bacterium GW2011_GWC2_53_7 TaxID=1618986 RepID=A0A0G1XWD2_9BACT|nr:MAG: hypothetical protein UY82_C0037G0002 [Candidatus Uhrbacteria bacterium GW2011_GWC2_53_7]HBL39133.1 hypothetical protein [Candidatus Uhrbacteria bacterium]